MISVPDYKEIVAASVAFVDYLVEHYRDRMNEPLPFDRRPNFALAVCQDDHGKWSVCLPLDLGDDEVVESIGLAEEGVKTRGDLIAYMGSDEWKEFLRWVAGVDENGNLLPEEETE
ncbi:hypothetical protein E0H68_06280 [Rhizobium leguminosarum bv. viciae]|uniref:hypothetical protein n=1 Tax=Rhizobium leguminosarum TaxID=384 RepID=UPI00103D0E97|nr:hypothetical protein [Rhizobium leguminosarum]TCA17378.1 hypothetical protein E0H68_06280 [Rhizobium leguminosarum bv. viciae]